MQENSNSILIFNTIVLYARLFIVFVCGLLSTRFALLALGASDFGLFAVVGSVIIFINIINTTMLSTCNRFLTTAIGRGNSVEINEYFNVNYIIQTVIALLTLVVAIPVGLFYIRNYIHYQGNIEQAQLIFIITLVSSAISFWGVSYNSLLMARERFYVFCLADIFCWIFRAGACYLLINHFAPKLFIYTLVVASSTVIPVLINYIYCKIKFSEYVRIKWARDHSKYKEIMSFSTWVGYGAAVQIAREQSIPILLNFFFNTLINAAYAISAQIKSGINMFASNLSKPISPQITKNYASGNRERCNNLMISSSKLSFFAMLIISSPFLVNTDYVLSIWLADVPDNAVIFTRLIIIDCLIGTLNMGIAEFVFASGNIKSYQLWTNTIYLIAILVSYLILRSGATAESILYVMIGGSVLSVIVRQIILHKVFHYDNMILVKGSYLPSLVILILFLPTILLNYILHPLTAIIIAAVWIVFIIYCFGLSKSEKNVLLSFITRHQ